MDTERTYTAPQLAEYLQVHRDTVYRWIRAGMPAINVGSAQRPDWRLRLPEVERWLQRRKPLPPAPRDEFGPL
jgi:excisionase family DNA binding protein